ncbi:pectinesterase inhibitor-like [Neltuma alba]|uniref:pectinesterase inhibitor-like n=1 Tax=Neltuma alba TaxID=207710 RepID=UPI0010A477A3|nr:pectinesterase inhibitor-like [Prosopis alba]
MARKYSPLAGSIIVVIFLCIAPCAYSNTPSVAEICSKHNNPVFCEEILKQKQGSDLSSLAAYVIEQIQIRVGSTKTALDSMVHQTQEPRLVQHYTSCAQHYDDALEGIKKTKQQLDNKDYFGMDVAASAVMTDIDDCASSEAPGYDPSVFLVKTNQDLENLCVIVMIIANRLSGN